MDRSRWETLICVCVRACVLFSHPQYHAIVCRFTDPLTKKKHKAKVAFQVWIRPNSYTKGKITVKNSGPVDERIPNEEIEWSTKERGAIIVYGLLAKIEDP